MKFVWSIVVYLIMAAVLCWGILLMMHGKPWLLIASLIAFMVAFFKLGCASH